MSNRATQILNEALSTSRFSSARLSLYVYDISLDNAERAFYAQSMRPESRGVMAVMDYARTILKLEDELKNSVELALGRGAVASQEKDTFIKDTVSDFRNWLLPKYNEYLSAESACMSSMVTGPARFPVERNRRKMDRASQLLDNIGQGNAKFIKNAMRSLFPDGDGTQISSASNTAAKQLTDKIEALKNSQALYVKANALARKLYPKGQLKPGTTAEQIEQLILNLASLLSISETSARTLIKPDYANRVKPFATYTMTNNTQNIKRLEQRLIEQNKLDETREDETFKGEFENGITYFVSDDNRICIDFGFKPNDEMRANLKSVAFKFSPSRGNLWVRQDTLNARSAFERCVKPKLMSYIV